MLLIFLVFCVVFFGGSVLLIFLVFCVVVFGGIRVAHVFSFLCCGFCGIRVAHVFSFLCCVFVSFLFVMFSCVHIVVSFFGFSILDFPFGFISLYLDEAISQEKLNRIAIVHNKLLRLSMNKNVTFTYNDI